MGKLFRRLSYWVRARRAADELAEEMEQHRALQEEALRRGGLSDVDAARASRRTLGNIALAREDARGVWIWPQVEHAWQDLRYAVRTAFHQASFTATAVFTLAIGIAAATTVVSVVEAELWRPLPFRDSERLAAPYLAVAGQTGSFERLSREQFLAWRAQNQSFDALAAVAGGGRRVLRGRPVPEFIRTSVITANLFDTLGWQPALGRLFTEQDERSPSVVVLTDAGWRRYFDAAADVVGRTIQLDTQMYAVVGVLPAAARLEFSADTDVYLPLDLESPAGADSSLVPIGRLRPGITTANAEADMRIIQAGLDREVPPARKGLTPRVDSLRAFYVGFNWRPLYFFLGAAAFLLILSCANVANLLLARALRRHREFAIRLAIGGGRGAIIRQLLVEGAVLAAPGTLLGVLLSLWMTRAVSLLMPTSYLSRGGAIQVDGRILAIAVAAGALTALCFGLAPALFTRVDARATLLPGSRTLGGVRSQRRVRHALVISQVSLALVLVFGAGLFFNSFNRLANQPLGFAPDDRFMMGIVLTGPRYAQPEDYLMFADRLRDAVGGIAGVARAAVATSAPLGSGTTGRFIAGGRPAADATDYRYLLRAVTPEYFDLFSIRRLAGRGFTDRDERGSTRVAIINQTLARRVFGDDDPVGREIVLLPGGARWVATGPLLIVGVVANSKELGMNEVPFNGLYVPFAQMPSPSFQLAAQSAVPSSQVADTVRRAVLDLDRDLPVVAVRTMNERVAEALKGDRFNLMLIGSFAVVALLLAFVAIYAAMSYAVEQRTAEFGLRLALGAPRRSVLGLALGSSLSLGTIGTALGLGVVFLLARLIGDGLYLVERQHEGLLYGITTTDSATMAFACAALISIAALAGVPPAHRAMRIDPAGVLRSE
jgi:predicted permease